MRNHRCSTREPLRLDSGLNLSWLTSKILCYFQDIRQILLRINMQVSQSLKKAQRKVYQLVWAGKTANISQFITNRNTQRPQITHITKRKTHQTTPWDQKSNCPCYSPTLKHQDLDNVLFYLIHQMSVSILTKTEWLTMPNTSLLSALKFIKKVQPKYKSNNHLC